MSADAFAPLADLLATDHTVITTDPRGVGRSPVDDPEQDSVPEVRADDLSRLLAHLGDGPAVALGSSGGAVSVLALAESHPGQLTTVIAHESPLNELVDDRDRLRAGTEDIIATYLAEGPGPAWQRFMALADLTPPPDGGDAPPLQGEPDPQAIADERHFFLHALRPTTRHRPDVAALRAGTPRIVVGIGEGSAGELCDRTSRALARDLGVEPTLFPGGHIGFLEDPAAFAARLRQVLS